MSNNVLSPATAPATDRGLVTSNRAFLELIVQERSFLVLLLGGFLLGGFVYPHPVAAAWIGFVFASYSAVANDSIQTLGTFIASNRDKPWWILWLFIGGVFLVTMTYGWITHGGDVSYERLAAKGFETAPTSFSYLQVTAPLFLLILTRLRMPVSTTFLLLSGFATSASSVGKVLVKSLTGYGAAMVVAMVVWTLTARSFSRMLRHEAHPAWRVAQWATTGMLWAIWLMQDAANIAVYLPRRLDTTQFIGFATIIFCGLGILFWMRGERIQQVVDEKSSVVDVRAATLVDLTFAALLYYFKAVSKIPMSTTWVFVGLLSGRELAITWMKANDRTFAQTGGLIAKDLASVTAGLVFSILLAMAVNEPFKRALLSGLGL